MRRLTLSPYLLLLAVLGAGPAAYAAGDMLTPDEVQTTGISANPANDSGFFLGAGLTFGQGRTTEGGSTPGLAVFGDVEPGYQFNRGSWGRMEVSGELLTGSVGFRTEAWGKATMAVPFGFLAKLGYGYSLGSKAFGVMHLGVGPVLAKLTVTPSIGNQEYSSDTSTGLAAMIGWNVVVPLTDALDATAGISWTQYNVDVGSVSSGGAKDSVGHVIANVPAADIGLRLRL